MASAYFTFPALLVIYVAQRAGELRSSLDRPHLGALARTKQLRAATAV